MIHCFSFFLGLHFCESFFVIINCESFGKVTIFKNFYYLSLDGMYLNTEFVNGIFCLKVLKIIEIVQICS